MALIELKDIDKTYDLGEVKVEALRGATLSIGRGDYVALVGPSGSGKSTLMNLLGCLDTPTRGDYRLADKEVSKLSRDQRARIRNDEIGFVFQNFNLLARTSAVENIELPLLYSNSISARQRRKRAVDLLEKVGVGDRLNHHPSQLSGGINILHHRLLVNQRRVVRPGRPAAPELYQLLVTKNEKLVMPPTDHEPLRESEIATIRRWIAAGAPPFPKGTMDPQGSARSTVSD